MVRRTGVVLCLPPCGCSFGLSRIVLVVTWTRDLPLWERCAIPRNVGSNNDAHRVMVPVASASQTSSRTTLIIFILFVRCTPTLLSRKSMAAHRALKDASASVNPSTLNFFMVK